MSEPRRGPVRALDALAGLVMGLAGAALVGMALVQAWQVFARYVLNDSPGWTEPLALLLMSFAVMFGAAVAVRRETHFAFQTFRDAAPERGRWLLKSLSRLIAAASGAGLMVLGGTLVVDEWPVAMAGAPLPSGLKFAGLCVGGALILLFAVERLLTGDYLAPEAVAGAED
ncbi:TRAP-type C4-dicarboxylate transport system permease small subunit [Brevundimonas alba]|uniref:TRAP transporter small permease protein n=1 Tax=Brevundimonas alba TaxID=74314 RepID=A0A7X6BN16_9CAUL|nr:TRAP transporter small permease [Brevundimonas alba]NJC41678.1 TRAP-type C4-dicarboxylate transport system permease small subunit [Brevundimonas alba]